MSSLMWLFDKMKTREQSLNARHTERCPILDILDKDGNRLNDLNLNLVASVLFDNADDILKHILLQEKPTQK